MKVMVYGCMGVVACVGVWVWMHVWVYGCMGAMGIRICVVVVMRWSHIHACLCHATNRTTKRPTNRHTGRLTLTLVPTLMFVARHGDGESVHCESTLTLVPTLVFV